MRWWSLVIVAACGRVGFDAVGDDGGIDSPPSCAAFGPWGVPEHLPDMIQSMDNDWNPVISDDGLTLVFDSKRSGEDLLYITTRMTTSDSFGSATAIADLNLRSDQHGAAWFGHTLYYSSYTQATGAGGMMFATYLGDGHFDTPQPVPHDFLGEEIEIAQEGRELFYTINPMMADYRLRHATRASTSLDWVADSMLDGFTPDGTVGGWPTYDDARFELYFERTVAASETEIAITKRTNLDMPFGPATAVTGIGTDAGDPEISRDGTTLFFASTRVGTVGLNDLWMSTRACQ